MAIGTISFQANGKADVFYVAQVREEGIELSDEALLRVEDPQFDSDKAWVTGRVPRIKPVNIEGDTAVVHAWFKGETFTGSMMITIYIECELAEELQQVTNDDSRDENGSGQDCLDPQEIHL